MSIRGSSAHQPNALPPGQTGSLGFIGDKAFFISRYYQVGTGTNFKKINLKNQHWTRTSYRRRKCQDVLAHTPLDVRLVSLFVVTCISRSNIGLPWYSWYKMGWLEFFFTFCWCCGVRRKTLRLTDTHRDLYIYMSTDTQMKTSRLGDPANGIPYCPGGSVKETRLFFRPMSRTRRDRNKNFCEDFEWKCSFDFIFTL